MKINNGGKMLYIALTTSMKSADRLDFLEAYDEVFDPDGSIKLCGRDKCKKLILMCESIAHPFGNPDTGCMYVEAIKKLHEEIINQQ